MKNYQIEVCPTCSNEVKHLPPDGISSCEHCERVVEGQTKFITLEEWEEMQ